MKSYTDLEQSQKLAEFLPLESADMWYNNNGESIAGRPEVRCCSFVGLASINIPCWSLAALLELIRNYATRYEISVYEGGFYIEFKDFITESYFNPLDAAFEMIILLKENGLL